MEIEDFTWKVFNRKCHIKTTGEEIQYRRTFYNKTDLKRGCLPKCRICLNELSLNTILKKDVYRHPVLEILICKTCNRRFDDSNFANEYCFWCCGNILFKTCVECTSHICLKCLENNFPEDTYNSIVNVKRWICFICQSEPLWHYRAECVEILDNNFTCKKEEIYDHIETNISVNSSSLRNIIDGSLNELSTFETKIEQETYNIDKAQSIVNFKMNIIKDLINRLLMHKGVLCDIKDLCTKYIDMPNEKELVESDNEKEHVENVSEMEQVENDNENEHVKNGNEMKQFENSSDKKHVENDNEVDEKNINCEDPIIVGKRKKLSLIEICSVFTEDELLIGSSYTTLTHAKIDDTSGENCSQGSEIAKIVQNTLMSCNHDLNDNDNSSLAVEPFISNNSISYDSGSSVSSNKTIKVFHTAINKNDNEHDHNRIVPTDSGSGNRDVNTIKSDNMSLNNDKNSNLNEGSDGDSDKSFVFDISSYCELLKETEDKAKANLLLAKEEVNICSEITSNNEIIDDVIQVDVDNPEIILLESSDDDDVIGKKDNNLNSSNFHKLYFFNSLGLQHTDKCFQKTLERNIANAVEFISTDDNMDIDIDADDESMDCEDSNICKKKNSVNKKRTTIRKKNDVADDIKQPNQLNNEYNLKECYVLLEKLEEIPQPRYKATKSKKRDDMKEIERLINIENIGKHKLSKTTYKKKIKKLKRTISLISSESESSFEMTDDNDTNSITSLEDLDEFTKKDLFDHENFEKDIINQITSDSSRDESDDKSIPDEIKKSRKKLKRSKSTDSNKENTPVKEENENLKKNKSNESKWRNDPLLRGNLSDTETELGSDGEIAGDQIISETIKNKVDKLIENMINRSHSNSKKKNQLNLIPETEDNCDKNEDLCDTDTESDIEFISEITKSNLKKTNSAICISSDEEMEESSLSQKKGRKNIRAILSDETLQEETKLANLMERQRIERLHQKEKQMSSVLSSLSQEEGLVLDVDTKTNETLIVVHPMLTKRLKSHQQNGVKFMWNNCFESVKRLQVDSGSGCILAHSMGLGKTFQVVTLIHTLFAHEVTKIKHVLVVCPRFLVLNWENEFKEGLKDLEEHDVKINVSYIGDQHRTPLLKLHAIETWRQRTGVLMIGYEAYQKLTKFKDPFQLTPQEQNIKKTLVDPGPDLVVLDEGHLLKNGQNLRTKSLMIVKTKRRIILTGTPLQNNLKEYYYMIQFVKPNILGSFREYSNRFINPITNGQYDDSTVEDIIQMKRRSYVLHKLLRKTIQRYEVSELSQYLPEKFDYVLFVQMHPLQIELYRKYIDLINSDPTTYHKQILSNYHKLRYVWTHPYLLYLERHSKPNEKPKLNSTDNTQNIQSFDDWWKDICPADYNTNIEYGPKFKIMLSIIHMCESLGDKVLVFCNSLAELDAIEFFLQQQSTDVSQWKPNKDYYRLDGSLSPETRHQLCKSFNDKSNKQTRVFLISYRVGGLGLNLVAANRVILMDVNFNPACDNQSLFRVYRFGQEKCCYVYRLVSMGTMEEVVYERQVTKLATFGRVIDDFQISRHYKSYDLQEMYRAQFNIKERPPLPLPHDLLLAKLISMHSEIFKYHEHQALLENLPEEELNEDEMKQAWLEFNKEEEIRNQAITAPKPLPGPSGINGLVNNQVNIVQPQGNLNHRLISNQFRLVASKNIVNPTQYRTPTPNNKFTTNQEKLTQIDLTVVNAVPPNLPIPHTRINLNEIRNIAPTSNNIRSMNPSNYNNNQIHSAKPFTVSQDARAKVVSLPIRNDKNLNNNAFYNSNEEFTKYINSRLKQTLNTNKTSSNNHTFTPTNSRIPVTNSISNGTPVNATLQNQINQNYNVVCHIPEKNNMDKNKSDGLPPLSRIEGRLPIVNYFNTIPNKNNNAALLTENNDISGNVQRSSIIHSNPGAIIEID